MGRSITCDGHTLADVENACAALRALGATDDTELRIRTTLTVNRDGGLPKALAGRWVNVTPGPQEP